jgi:hypothetical protein
MRHILFLLSAFFLVMKAGSAQDISVRGVVMEEKLDGSLIPIEFANVYWLKKFTTVQPRIQQDTSLLPTALTDGDRLIFQFLGFEPDTVKATPGQYISVLFKEEASLLGEVVVVHRKRTTEVSFLDPCKCRTSQRRSFSRRLVATCLKALKPMLRWM